MTVDVQALQQQEVALLHRLDMGLPKIQDGLAAGKDVSRWEAVWLQLLREYEICHDKLVALGAD